MRRGQTPVSLFSCSEWLLVALALSIITLGKNACLYRIAHPAGDVGAASSVSRVAWVRALGRSEAEEVVQLTTGILRLMRREIFASSRLDLFAGGSTELAIERYTCDSSGCDSFNNMSGVLRA